MQFEGALVREQGVTFAIVVVKKAVIDDRGQAQEAARVFGGAFPGVPIVLMGQDHRGRATYFGRPDIVRFLSRVSIGRIPWKRYTMN